ncbi:MAG: ferritin-like domain-containing protein [Myxococcales bacterium]|nr:ferritin-like domain-containing protein [Myxococcales bacterium]
MTALRQRILLALGAPVVALGCPREPVLGAGTDASLPSASTASSASSSTSVEEETGPVPDVGPTVVDTGVVDTGVVDSGTADAASAKKAAKVTYTQYKPKVAPPNYCPQTSTAQCMSLDDAVYQSTFPNVPATKPKVCPPQLAEACPCHPAAPMGCHGGVGPPPMCSVALLGDVTTAERKKTKTDVCCYETQQVCVPPWVGRALRAEARDVIADVTVRDDWAKGGPTDGLRSVRFLRAALGEHAAIASFSLTALALLAHGAPAELVADTHRAALDEVEHARLMFGLAGQGLGPGALALPPLRIPTAVELVTSTFRDACVQETIGAVAVRAEAEEETDPAVRAALETIADDEERHAILAYRTLAWALSVSGEAGRAALRSELAALDSTAPLVTELVVPCAEAALSAGALASLS